MPLDWSRPIAAKTARTSRATPGRSRARRVTSRSTRRTRSTRWRARACVPSKSAGFDALFDAANDVDHVRSGFRYRPVRRGKQYFVSETLLGTDGKPVATWEEPVTHVFSAGSYGLALYSRRNGRLSHLPIDYYAQAKRWDLDPMAFGGNPRMNVQLDTFCISCHSDEPAKRYDDPLPGGIGCERCHGPSKKHVVSQKPEDTIGPAQLSMRRQLELCTQCHESTFEQQRARPRPLRLPSRRAARRVSRQLRRGAAGRRSREAARAPRAAGAQRVLARRQADVHDVPRSARQLARRAGSATGTASASAVTTSRHAPTRPRIARPRATTAGTATCSAGRRRRCRSSRSPITGSRSARCR